MPKSQSITGMMTLSFLLPVLGLSIFSHQEPRFIIPILLPLVFLYSHLIKDFQEHCELIVPFRKLYPKRKNFGVFQYPLKFIEYFEKLTENIDNRYNINGRYLVNLRQKTVAETTRDAKPRSDYYSHDDDGGPVFTDVPPPPETDSKEEKEKKMTKRKREFVMNLWYVINVGLVIFFGFFHQGGIYGLSRDFGWKIAEKPKYTTYHLITSHVYTIPQHLFSVKRHPKYKNPNFATHELGSSENFENINVKLINVLKYGEEKRKKLRKNYRVFYAFPTSLYNEFKTSHEYYKMNYTYKIDKIFFPHLSTEALPNLIVNTSDDGDVIRMTTNTSGIFNVFDCVPLRYFIEFFHQFGLILIEINMAEN